MGLWLVLFLIEHLLTNSQAALWVGENGQGFVRMVNGLHNLPYLQVIEITLLGIPILIHLVWGVKYLFTAKSNSRSSDGTKPSLPEYGRNRAYTWQRITSWILLFCIIGHVVKFRFLEYPASVQEGSKASYFIRVSLDNGLYTVADRLGVKLYDQKAVVNEVNALKNREAEGAFLEAAQETFLNESSEEQVAYNEQKALLLASKQKLQEKAQWVTALANVHLSKGDVVAVCKDFGTATLLAVRDVFKNPIYVVLYTIFVLAACFHAFNGLWTFMITWGWILKAAAQKKMVTFCIAIMLMIACLGLAAVWGTYWVNLRY
jgi:succinate dehydrogenase / fumarate reductase cytochrome b subunit